MIQHNLRNLAILCFSAFNVLGSTPSRADEPACATASAWTPCQLFPPGLSIADHSGSHDHGFRLTASSIPSEFPP